MEAVLGLSMTSTGVGWVLLDGQHTDGAPLDHDAFDVLADVAADGDFSRHLAAVRGAQAIAASSGHQVRSVNVTWTDGADAVATPLLKALPDFGFDNIVSVGLPQAAREWAQAFRGSLEFETCAVCIIESTAVTVLAVPAMDGSVRTFVTRMRESADGLAQWLTGVFDGSHWQPDTVFLVGSRGDLELISESLDDALPMPVVASDDAQLVLARGAAVALSADADVAAVTAPHAVTPAHRLFRFPSYVAAAGVLVAGAIALLAIGPGFAGQNQSGSADDLPSADSSASVTSATAVSPATPKRVRAVTPTSPAMPPSAEMYQLGAEPPPVAAQPEAPSQSAAALPPEPDQVVASPVVAPVVASQEPVAAPVAASPEPIAAPVAAPQAPIAPESALNPPAPIAPPPGPPPPPPQDPVATVLSPLFGALP